MLGEILRVGQVPPPRVILCAIAEAQAIGRDDLASDIVNAFVVPAVQHHERMRAHQARAMHSRGSYAPYSCTPSCSPRAQADARSCAPAYARASCAPAHDRGACAPRAEAAPAPAAPSAAVPQMTSRPATDEEVIAMLNSDPEAFMEMASSRRFPVIDVPMAAPAQASAPSAPSPQAAPAVPQAAPIAPPVPQPPQPSLTMDALAEQLLQLPGFAGAGVTSVDPSRPDEVFEISWLRGYPLPMLPPMIEDRAVRFRMVAELPVAQPQPTGLHPETVAQMQEAAGLPEAADQTRAMAPGSPLGGVSDDAWRQFVMRLEREAPQFSSSRHVGQYRQRRERLAELGIDAHAVHGSAQAQRAALDADLADAHHHAAAAGLLAEHLGRPINVPGRAGSETITLSGLLGVIQCAGLEGAVGWLESPNDRKRYPHTTQAFLSTNAIF